MYKIGDFSIMSKTTIKTLRYYEKEKLLIPAYVDKFTGYRYYEASQLKDLYKIIALRQIGISISDIRGILNGLDMNKVLEKRKEEVEKDIILYNTWLSKINYLLEEENMKNEIFLKELPACTVYYKEGVLNNYSEVSRLYSIISS